MSAATVSAIAKRFQSKRLNQEDLDEKKKVEEIRRCAAFCEARALTREEAKVKAQQDLRQRLNRIRFNRLFPAQKVATFLRRLGSLDNTATVPTLPVEVAPPVSKPITAHHSNAKRQNTPSSTLIQQKVNDTTQLLTQGRKLLGIRSSNELKNFNFEPSTPCPNLDLQKNRNPIKPWPIKSEPWTNLRQIAHDSTQVTERSATHTRCHKLLMRNLLNEVLTPAIPEEQNQNTRKSRIQDQELKDSYFSGKSILTAMGEPMLRPFSFHHGDRNTW